MANVFVNRAFVYTATTGTGTITLGSPVSGYQSFADAGVADTNTVRYLIIDDSAAWEIGTGTYTASGTTLARSVEESSNSDALLNLSGNATVSVIVDAADITSLLSNLFENPLFLRERSAAASDQAAYGQLWVKNSTPNELWYTDDAGNDYHVLDPDILKADTSDDLTVGYTATPHDEGTVTTGTFTPDMTEGNLQQYINGGAHTLAAPSGEGTMIIQVTNNASAGTITVSGFTDQDGDSLTTTDGDDFFLYIAVINGFSTLTVKALQ